MTVRRTIVPLTGLDGAFLDLETPATPMHVGSLHLLERRRPRQQDFYSALRETLAERLDVAPIFGRRLVQVPLNLAHPVWVDGVEVDLDFHVRRVRVPAPGTLAELERATAGLHAELMDRGRPLWMLYVLEGLADGREAYFFKIHHAVLDGAAGTQLALALFDTERHPRRRRRPAAGAAGAAPGTVAIAGASFGHDLGQFVRFVRYLPTAAKALAGIVGVPGAQLRHNLPFGPRTPLNVSITPERSVAVLSLPLAEVRRIGGRHAATLNDVVLALCGGTLRRYLARHGGIPAKGLIAAMPISLREAGDTRYGTEVTMSLVNLATEISDPLARLAAVRLAADASKSFTRRARPLIPTDFPSVGVPWLVHGLAALYGPSHAAELVPPVANLVISNVPGPPLPLYTAGRRMLEYWPLSIVEHGVGLNITVISYADALGFGFTCARAAVPDAGELAADLGAAYEELVIATRTQRRAPTRRRAAARRRS